MRSLPPAPTTDAALTTPAAGRITAGWSTVLDSWPTQIARLTLMSGTVATATAQLARTVQKERNWTTDNR